MEEGFSYATDDGFVIGKPESLTLHIDIDGLCKYKAIKATYGGVEHTYDPAKLKDALIWLLAPYEIHENPSNECMRREREEKRATLLDMRRWDVARRLKALELPEFGSHDMLSRIVKTIYDPIGGWTREACESLRNQLIELMGGTHASSPQCGSSCHSDTCVCNDMQEEVGDGISGGDCGVREVRHDRDLHLRDMGDCYVSKEALMTYDVLGNERHKAVCNLLKIPDATGNFSFESHYFHVQNIFDALGIQEPHWARRVDALRDRLIHLLGGDQVVRYPENYDSGDEPDAQNDKNGDFCKSDHATITDELRTYAEGCFPGPHNALIAIANRIDAQFVRVCKQHERVLQDIDHMQDEIDEHKEQRRVLAGDCLDYTDEFQNLYDLLRDAARDYKHECEKYCKALNKAMGNWAKADAECRMYRDILNDEAREYVRHKEATDSMYKSFNEVFEVMERLL